MPYKDYTSRVARESAVKRTMAWRQRNKVRAQTIYLRWQYGITYEELQSMFDQQEGLCAVCSAPMCLCIGSGQHRRKCPTKACIDHHHESGKIRGLLCHGCNVAIGYIKESPNSLRNAAAYLEMN